MLYWLKFFILVFFISFISFLNTTYSLLFLLLQSELLIIILFFLFLSTAIIFQLNFLIGLAFTYLIFGGMEIALNLILIMF